MRLTRLIGVIGNPREVLAWRRGLPSPPRSAFAGDAAYVLAQSTTTPSTMRFIRSPFGRKRGASPARQRERVNRAPRHATLQALLEDARLCANGPLAWVNDTRERLPTWRAPGRTSPGRTGRCRSLRRSRGGASAAV